MSLKAVKRIQKEIEDIKEELFHFDIVNAEVFSQQISSINERKEMLKIANALNNAKNLYNVIRLSGKYDMLDRLDFKINDLSTECRVPNKDNPFMNPTLTDYGSNLQPPPKSCPSYNNKGVQRRVEELFNEDLYRDVTDVFGKNNSQRQFYTVPGNRVPNDQGNFAQWLYGTPPTCKEGNGLQCAANQLGEHRGVGSPSPSPA